MRFSENSSPSPPVPTFMTLKRLSWPKPSFSLKKSCSGKVRAMSRRMSFSHGDVFFMCSRYSCFQGESCTPSTSCHAIPRNSCGMPFRTSSWGAGGDSVSLGKEGSERERERERRERERERERRHPSELVRDALPDKLLGGGGGGGGFG